MFNPSIKVEVESSAFDKETWTFYAVPEMNELRLRTYTVSHRKSLKHKWKAFGVAYDRYNRRDSYLKLEAVPLPDAVKAEAMYQFIKIVSQFKVVK